MAQCSAEYILVHFPYFKHEATSDVHQTIEKGLQKLSAIQSKYNIQIVCEPKLGFRSSKAGINYLQSFPLEIWAQYQIKLCIDIGDYLIATGDRVLDYLDKWIAHIKVIHLHNVQFLDDKYFWIPVHPSHENSSNHYSIEGIIRHLKNCENAIFIFEHTPHSKVSKEFIEEGYRWVEEIVRGNRKKTCWE